MCKYKVILKQKKKEKRKRKNRKTNNAIKIESRHLVIKIYAKLPRFSFDVASQKMYK